MPDVTVLERTKPTAEQIAEQIEWLKKMKPRIRQFNAFMDDHWAGIDAQIKVLETGMTRGEIYRLWKSEDICQLDNALEVRAWLDGEPGNERPSTCWEPLVLPE